jgi:hypothetical protein
MPIAVSCTCGKAFRLKDELAGRKVRCSACNAVIAVPTPAVEGELDAEALNMLLTEDVPRSSRPRPPAIEQETAIQSDAPRPAPRMPARLPDPEPREPKPRRAKRTRADEGGGYRRIYVSPGVITGVLMMVVAVIWFFGALALNWIFFYPPIMFVLGFIAVVKGLLGHEED